MKKQPSPSRRRGPNIWPPRVSIHDVTEIDTRRCLKMTMRLLRPKALPEVERVPARAFLN